MTKAGVLACVLGLGFVAGCAVDGDAEPEVTEAPRIGLNALSPAALFASELTVGQLTSAHAAAMASNTYSQGVLSYAIGCALAGTQSVTYTVNGTTYTDTGSFGIATSWTVRSLTTAEAAWISACVIARVNLTSTSVTISARGAQTGYTTTSAELTNYQIEEGAFWGNVFTDKGSIAGYSCNGVDQAANDTYGDLPLRQCAQPDPYNSSQSPCGLSYAGLCSAVCSTSGTYSGCTYPGGTTSSQVVTTFLYGTPQ